MMNKKGHTTDSCTASILPVQFALYVLNRKWKLSMTVALLNGPQRLKEIQRSFKTITPQVLFKRAQETGIE